MRRAPHAEADAEAADGHSWVDDRLAAEPKAPDQKRSRDDNTCSAKNLARFGAIVGPSWGSVGRPLPFSWRRLAPLGRS